MNRFPWLLLLLFCALAGTAAEPDPLVIAYRVDSEPLQFRNEQGVEIDEAVPAMTRLDPVRFRQLLLNLLSNAVKYTEKSGVSLRASPQEAPTSPRLGVTISDSGIGMSAQQIDKAFSSFTQLGDMMTHADGTGLGPTNAKYLAELMGGEMEIENEPGNGTRVRLSIPLS